MTPHYLRRATDLLDAEPISDAGLITACAASIAIAMLIVLVVALVAR